MEKLKTFQFDGILINNPWMFISAFIGGTMLSFASHGADYMMVQRILATNNLSSARKAMIGSGFFVLFQFLVFLFIGSLIYLVAGSIEIEKDREVTYILNNFIPVGFRGIVIAGVLSAAMSTLSSSINSLSSTTIKDWFPSIKKISITRFIAIFWTVILVLLSFIFNESTNALVIIGLKIASYTYGCLLSFFILAKIKMKFSTYNIIMGYVYAIISVLYFMEYEIAWTFYILGSVITFLTITIFLEIFKKRLIVRDILSINIFFMIFMLIDNSSSRITLYDLSIPASQLKENKVWTGYDLIAQSDFFAHLNNVGLLINHTSSIVDVNKHNNKINLNLNDFNVKIIFTPEHGFLGDYQAGEKVEYLDDGYNIPVISLYGKNLSPNDKYMEGLDAIIFDIQDIGSRYYTYVSTMTYMMEACSDNDILFYVLDRPNPLSGKVEGPVLDSDFTSFVGMHSIPIRHGMTIGEMAYTINENNWLQNNKKVDLHIVKMSGWDRSMYFNDTNIHWISPSPNIPDIDSAILYNGICLFEATNISEGRGTDFPFQIIGSPWFNSDKIIKILQNKNLDGVEFSNVSFVPRSIKGKSISPKYLNQKCNGIKINIIEKDKIQPLAIALYILDATKEDSNFKITSNDFFDKLYGTDILRKYLLKKENNIDEIIDGWKNIKDERHLIYK